MPKTLLVPIHLDALCLSESQSAVSAMAQYNRLPYTFEGSTYNSGELNLSKTILSGQFSQEFTLRKGIHLHWSLPDALTNGEHGESGTTFPKVPNRWLILRQGGSLGNKQWIVESDYLYPVDFDTSTVEFPYPITILIDPPAFTDIDPNDTNTYLYQRYRYMGKSWVLDEYPETGDYEYASALTAIGTKATVPVFDDVKATFAAFYPNCHSVFGFCDEEAGTDSPPAGLQYDVVGWYSDGEQDCLAQFLAEHPDIQNDALLEKLQEKFNWTLEDVQGLPERTLYHSRITFAGASRSASERVSGLDVPTIAVANSTPDAISAYLAQSFNAETSDEGQSMRKTVEEKLEALQISERLESRTLDIGAKFREGRHEEGFSVSNGGFLWTITSKMAQNETRFSRTTGSSQAALPESLAQQLNALNRLQEIYNQAWLDIESMRQRLYSQWYYFMENQNTDIWEIIDASLVPLWKKIAETGELDFSSDNKFQEITLSAKSLPFGIISRLDDKYDGDAYFTKYVECMNNAEQDSWSDWGDYIEYEYGKCGVTFSASPVVSVVTAAVAEDFYEGAVWQIQDDSQIYEVKVEGGIFNIYVPPTPGQIACDLVTQLNEVWNAIATHNQTPGAKQYTLAPFPSQNYWRANDPVILLTGDVAKAPNRFGQDGRLRDDGLLTCAAIEFDISTILEQIDTLQTIIEGLKPQETEESINFITWKEQPWSPFAFHWSVLVHPCRDSSDSYSSDDLLNHYQLSQNAIDLQLKEGQESAFNSGDTNSYTGFSILTPSVGIELTERLTHYLLDQVLPEYAQSGVSVEQTSEYLQNNWETILDWYKAEYELGEQTETAADDPRYVALWAYGQMQDLDCQAQMIGGFNDTLLLSRPTLQLGVDDPLPSSAEKKQFHEQVRWSLGHSLQRETLSLDVFNPIRSGAMSIPKLWLIDSFGQHKVVRQSGQGGTDCQIVTPDALKPPSGSDYPVLLSPRLAQSARLNFHWLAAESDPGVSEVEMTTKPLKTPVCGWLVPNNLDSTLAVCDRHGQSLGAIDVTGTWRTAPGKSGTCDGNGYPLLSNSHLQKMVHFLLEQGNEFQQQFISTLENSLENIDPDSYAQHPSLALLVGRPLAVVRAIFSLEVKGLPACDPTVLVENIEQGPATYGFTEVNVPIRLGDYQQLNDGLVGYWKETLNGDEGYDYEGKTFYATQSNLTGDGTNLIQTEAEGINHFQQTVDATPQGITMLIDPRGVIHATCGLLPNQELRLPPESYADALQAIEVNFLATPILSDQSFVTTVDGATTLPELLNPSVAIPLPQEAGFDWSWVSLDGEEWTESTAVQPVNLSASFSKPQKLYEGWLQLSRKPEDT